MRINATLENERFEKSWIRLLIQGLLLLVFGISLALSSIFNADASIMNAKEFSWLPVTAIIIVFLGLEECLEAYMAKVTRELHQNLQVGILDTVVGGLIILSVSTEPERIAMLVAAFLLVRGSVRIVLVHVLKLPQKLLMTLFGSISVILGTLVAFELFNNSSAFLAFCLNLEVAFRGWAMMSFAWWVRKRKKLQAPGPNGA
jgi:uncharacterized membrane protein HdeD (DUF308 family)